jgi:anhydro-N-acetylmuramic acid kinase
MSGTSLDGIDVAIVDIPKKGTPNTVAFHHVPYSKQVREALLGVSNTTTHTADVARLSFLLGELYADAILATCRRKKVALESVDLCGMHGQTIFHEGTPVEFLGRKIASTMQIGDASVVAERTGLTVISNFRERDMAAGGKGAPLVPFVDYLLFRDALQGRVALNIGGIANISILPPRAKPSQVIAFDTGPGNMAIDALVTRMSKGRETYDRGGAIARSGKVDRELLAALLQNPYFELAAPKTAGREQFGAAFVERLLATGSPIRDLVATATEFTAESIARAIRSTSLPGYTVVAAGGGVHNRWLMGRIGALLPGWKITSSAAFGVNPDAKEAVAFAILAYETFRKRPSNLPSATGAKRAVVLGQLSYGDRTRSPGN